MNRKLLLLLSLLSLITLTFIITSFSKKENNKNYWYNSKDAKGYISIQKISSKNTDNIEVTSVNTEVNAKFKREKIRFKLSTESYSSRMLDPIKLTFNGVLSRRMKPVNFIGTVRNSKVTDSTSLWSFKGGYIKDLTKINRKTTEYSSEYSEVMEMPSRTIPSFNLWAIVPNLPFDKAGTFRFNMLDETKLRIDNNLTINYLGKYKTLIYNKELTLHKFVQQGKKMKPTYYWVNDDKVLIQVLLDNKFTFTITTKEKALDKISSVRKSHFFGESNNRW